ncbi:MAG TPA: sugar phosphate isomerase/epimerase family protein [Phycisphaerae bacterium]|nr:sugar phosphate isomerase/epimerase family protein [Phycisphaerae bacterium]HOJ76302.1 sugar phosphate isomerase/epimerase family protein [Phycisphaerae bacterium]HOM53714.1 sugar phosphate isomerase/epimerase family protein [Phycisphaerae bacterium]HON67890.1 sugar phosphate isomerase/epimerase family protein [Phycisphaerae bacterium]HOQ88371.1 sugar phosphate isomerase/epimerase family protein [Phycisphaerae bacterium]
MPESISRRGFLQASAVSAVAASVGSPASRAADRPIPGDIVTPRPERKYQLGMVTYNIAPDWDIPTIIERCRELGLAAVELRSTHKHGVEPTLSKAERREVRKRFADSPVRLWGLGSACEYHSTDPAVVAKNIELTKQFIELAADVGAATLKVRPNGLPKEVSEEQTLEQIGRSLRTVGQAAEAAGVEICCEMHGHGTSEPRHMRRIMEIADHPAVGVTWNSNPVDVQNETIRHSFEMMRPWIRNVHINELTSTYPWRELFTLLRSAGYDRYTLMEIQNLQTQDPKDVMRFLRFYKALWEELSRPC